MLAPRSWESAPARPETAKGPPGPAQIDLTREPIATFSPVTDYDRVKFTRRMGKSISGSFVPPDGSTLIQWCGMAELALLSVMSLDHRVDRMEGRVERVSVSVDGRRVSRIPLVRATMGPLRLVADVGSLAPDMDWAVAKAYERRGDAYRVFTRAEVEAQPRQRNARLILGARRHRPEPDLEMALLKRLSSPGPHTIRSLQQSLPGHKHVRQAVYSFCLRRRLAIELWADDPLDMIVRLTSAERWLP